MAVQLDESNVNAKGNDVNVIHQKITATVGIGSKIFEIFLWILFIIPGLIFTYKKVKADNYFQQLQQKIQKNASQIGNYMEQRVNVLQNCELSSRQVADMLIEKINCEIVDVLGRKIVVYKFNKEQDKACQ